EPRDHTVIRYRQRRQGPHDLARDPEPLATGREQTHAGADREDGLGQRRTCLRHVLAVVEHEKERLLSETLAQHLRGRRTGRFRQSKRPRDYLWHERRI